MTNKTDRATDHGKETREELISHILEEARMVLPGIQALLGFQLVAVFNQGFDKLSSFDKDVHLLAIFLSVNAICFLLTPAALHRMSCPDRITHELTKTSSRLICMGMMPLLLSIVLDSYVVFNSVLESPALAGAFGGILFAELVFRWLIWPKLKKDNSGATNLDC